jgi:hypothetical protein
MRKKGGERKKEQKRRKKGRKTSAKALINQITYNGWMLAE